MNKRVIVETEQVLSFTYWIARSDINQFLQDLDLFQDKEGLFWQEKGKLSFKTKKVIDEKWKDHFVNKFIEGYDMLGFTICNIVFDD